MSNLTLSNGWPVRDRPQQRSPSRDAVLLRSERETSSETQILALKLHFSAAC
jgi:hypothetical protein